MAATKSHPVREASCSTIRTLKVPRAWDARRHHQHATQIVPPLHQHLRGRVTPAGALDWAHIPCVGSPLSPIVLPFYSRTLPSHVKHAGPPFSWHVLYDGNALNPRSFSIQRLLSPSKSCRLLVVALPFPLLFPVWKKNTSTFTSQWHLSWTTTAPRRPSQTNANTSPSHPPKSRMPAASSISSFTPSRRTKSIRSSPTETTRRCHTSHAACACTRLPWQTRANRRSSTRDGGRIVPWRVGRLTQRSRSARSWTRKHMRSYPSPRWR